MLHLGTLPGADLPPQVYDVVTMWQALEHVPSPKATLEAVRRLLRPGVERGGLGAAGLPTRRAWGATAQRGGSGKPYVFSVLPRIAGWHAHAKYFAPGESPGVKQARRTSANMPRQRRPGHATLQVNLRTLNRYLPTRERVDRHGGGGAPGARPDGRSAGPGGGGLDGRGHVLPGHRQRKGELPRGPSQELAKDLLQIPPRHQPRRRNLRQGGTMSGALPIFFCGPI